ncbi:hypothetical protein YC2023_094007 [Brassica napus]
MLSKDPLPEVESCRRQVWELPTRTRKQNVFHASVRMRSGPNPAYQSTFSMISYTTIQGHFKFNLYESNPASVRYDSLSR